MQVSRGSSVELFRRWELTERTMINRDRRSKIIIGISAAMFTFSTATFLVGLTRPLFDREGTIKAVDQMIVGAVFSTVFALQFIWSFRRAREGGVLIEIYKRSEEKLRGIPNQALIEVYKEAIRDLIQAYKAAIRKDVRHLSLEHRIQCGFIAKQELKNVEAAERSRLSRWVYFLWRRG